MRILRRLAATLVMFVAVVGIVACIAAMVGVWIFRQYASEKVEVTSTRLEDGLERASLATQHVRNALTNARAAVAEVNKESAKLGASDERGGRAKSAFLRGLLQREVGPNVDNAAGRLATLSDAAVAAAAVLRSFGDLPPRQAAHLDREKLERLAGQAAQLSTSLGKLQSTLGEAGDPTTEQDVVAATNQVDLVLESGQSLLDNWQTDLNGARDRVASIKSEILAWLTPGALAITLISAWLAVSQVSLFAHGRKWFHVAD